MAMPTVGRIVHYFRPHVTKGGAIAHGEPMAAIVCAISDIDSVNISFFDRWGTNIPERNVRFAEGEPPESGIAYCQWPKREE